MWLEGGIRHALLSSSDQSYGAHNAFLTRVNGSKEWKIQSSLDR